MSSSTSDSRCPNCDAELRGPYCAACGQRQVDLGRPGRRARTVMTMLGTLIATVAAL